MLQDDKKLPKYYESDFKFSLDDILGKEVVSKSLNLADQTFLKNEREELLKKIFQDTVIPLLNEISTREGIKKVIKKHDDLKYYLTVDLKKYLGIKEKW
jgi:hypothetical protein